MIVKVDEIGDYILFRNYLKILRNSIKYRDKKILLCGNIAWKNIFDNLDSEFVDECIWLNKTKFKSNYLFRRKFLQRIAQLKIDTAINCSYSRNFYLDDTIIKTINANFKVGFKTDLANQFAWQRDISNKYYSELVSEAEFVRFEFYKNRILFEKLLDQKIEVSKPFIEQHELIKPSILLSKSAAFYMGAKQRYRRWHIDNFVQVAKKIITKYNFKIILLGSTQDVKLSNELRSKMQSEEIVDLTAKTSLMDTFGVLRDVEFFLTNDSGLAHIAIALNCKTVVLSNGSRFGRFFPYPKEINKDITTLFPPKLDNCLDDETYLQSKYNYTSGININDIEISRVQAEIEKMINNEYL
jgi:ADP-heptose:LPS heptosyltransferase